MAAHPLFANVRRSPYFAATERAGAATYMAYNHMYMPMSYGRSAEEEYEALTERAALWDVGAERQVEIAGADARRFADWLLTRDMRGIEARRCRYALACDATGRVLADVVVFVVEDQRIWLSHGNVDLLHWARGVAHQSGYDVSIGEPDVAPLQVHGPRARDVLRPLVGEVVDELPYYRLAPARIAGQPAIVARTGWSGELGFEVLPLGSGRALEIWDAIVAAGAEHGLLVTGPNVVRAVESGIRDTTWATGMGANGLELDNGRLVDFDGADFIGRAALQRIRDAGAARSTVGLVGEGSPLPRLDGPWHVRAGDRVAGSTRWAVHSHRLGLNLAIALVDTADAVAGTRLLLDRPDGELEPVTVTALPFLPPPPGARD